MATIKLFRLHCERLQDEFSEDEIKILVGGIKVAGPIGIHKNGYVDLGGIERDFTGTVDVQLVEIDGKNGGKNDDPMGTRHASDEVAVPKTTWTYKGHGGTYDLEYSVALS